MKLPLALVVLVCVGAGCNGTDSLSGVYVGDAQLAECNASGTKVASTADNEQFRLRDDGNALQVTWRGCTVVGVEQSTSGRTWTVAAQSCTLDNIASTVRGQLYKGSEASSSVTIQLEYKPTAQSGACESSLDVVVSR